MPPFPAERFLEAVVGIVDRNRRFVPDPGEGSFYVRPLQHGIEPLLGIRPAREFHVLILGSPVGDYFADGSGRGLKLRVLDQGRVAAGGTGAAKAMGNYAGGVAIAAHWRDQGYDDVLYLDASGSRRVTETTGSNVFVLLRDGTLVTPPTDDQILAGITRDSVLRLARERLAIPVVERQIGIDEVLEDGAEVFCTGTAYTVHGVDELVHGDRARRFDDHEVQRALLDALTGIQRGEKDDPWAGRSR